MKKESWDESKIVKLVDAIVQTYSDEKGVNHNEGLNLPNRKVIYEALDKLFMILFPGYIKGEIVLKTNINYFVGDMLNWIYTELKKEIEKSLKYQCQIKKCSTCDCGQLAQTSIVNLLESIPKIRETLKTDVLAAFDGDPASASFDEIILSYPCVEAIGTYRLAHELYKSNIPLVPRIMSERAHSKTGIDIHPGAEIGESFFIDHGTGVVIGETSKIGKNVKIYQGVTLGALSFRRDEKGRIIKGGKRHPTIEDDVTIYSGETILGGETVIGKGSVVGGNVWLTTSVPAYTTVCISKPDLVYKKSPQV